MRVRSSSVASVSTLWLSVTSSPLRVRYVMATTSRAPAHLREHALGLGDHAVDHLARGHDVLDEARALSAGRVPAVDVALLAGADGGGETHALGLEGKGQDLRGTLLPLARELVPDGAAGLAGGAAMHHRPLFIDGHDLLLVVVVPEGLVGGDEARAHPDSHRAQIGRAHV